MIPLPSARICVRITALLFYRQFEKKGFEMENFLLILTKPDNIPIAFMIPLVAFFVWLAISQGLRHDRLIKKGKKDDVYDEMIR